MDRRVDFAAVKSRQRAAWSAGDYAIVGTTLQIVAKPCARRSTCAGVPSMAAECNATLRRRRYATTPPTTSRLCSNRPAARPRRSWQFVTFREADAEQLPFADDC